MITLQRYRRIALAVMNANLPDKPAKRALDPAERLLNLVIALVNTQGRMTREQIRTSVAGYESGNAEAFERMFERDKDLLRDLGVPIVTVDASGHPDDVGYRVDNDAYALGPIDLTPAEYAVLGLAADFWQDRSLQLETTRALTKLRALGGSLGARIDAEAASILAPRVRQAGDAHGPIFDALIARRAVKFDYRAASTGLTETRTVEPWRIAARSGGWYLVGYDRDRESVRAFRLSRIAGKVRALGAPGTVEIPADVDVDSVLGLGADQPREALLALKPERAGAIRARATGPRTSAASVRDDGREIVSVPFTNLVRFAGEVAGYGDAIVVVGPHDLREAVLTKLRAARAVALAPQAGETRRRDGTTEGGQ